MVGVAGAWQLGGHHRGGGGGSVGHCLPGTLPPQGTPPQVCLVAQAAAVSVHVVVSRRVAESVGRALFSLSLQRLDRLVTRISITWPPKTYLPSRRRRCRPPQPTHLLPSALARPCLGPEHACARTQLIGRLLCCAVLLSQLSKKKAKRAKLKEGVMPAGE